MKQFQVYKITTNTTPIYIGCSSQKLSTRLRQHCTDSNSQVYKNTFAKNLYLPFKIEIINIKMKYNNNFINLSQNIAFKYEEILTYIYGMKYKLYNENAGNVFYNSMDDYQLYTHIHMILNDLIDDNILFDISELYEILLCINESANIYKKEEIYANIHDISSSKYIQMLKNLDDYFINLLCDIENI